jgi:hypothetical protein
MAINDVLFGKKDKLNVFGAPSQGEWNLSKGVYTTKKTGRAVTFFYENSKGEDPLQKTAIDQISDKGGRRLAKYEYPYSNGQGLADLGRKAESMTFNIKFHGLNYQQKFKEFLDVVTNNNEQGTLLHPIRGPLTVRFEEYEFVHRYDEWNSITIKAVFQEDNTDQILSTNLPLTSQDSALRSAVQNLSDSDFSITDSIKSLITTLNIPSAIQSNLLLQKQQINGQVSGLLGQLAASFSSNSQILKLLSQSVGLSGGSTGLSSGTALVQGSAVGVQVSLPPVFQVGFDPATQASINSQLSNYVSANQITPQQAVFAANQARLNITVMIAAIESKFGNFGYSIVVQYRGLANSMQAAVEASIAATQNRVKIYTVPRAMSLRMVAQENGLPPSRQNDIEALNPYLGSVNYVPANTILTVPAA